MTQTEIDEKDEILSDKATCIRLLKGFIVRVIRLGEKLQSQYSKIELTDDPDADEEAWTALIQEQYGIEPEDALMFADFSMLPETTSAPVLPSQHIELHDALKLLAYLVPADSEIS